MERSQAMLERRLDPATAAVVVVDAQNDFCSLDGVQARQGRDVSFVAEPLRALERFLPVARAVGVPVVFIRNLHEPTTDTQEWIGRHPDPDRASSCVSGTWGAEFAIQPAPGDHIVEKNRYSAFTRTDLERVLRTLGRKSLLFTGFTTSVCVESSLREAVCLDFLVTLVDDCCGAYSDDAHARAAEAVRGGFGVVATSDEIVGVWSQRGLLRPTSAGVSWA